MTMLDRMRRHKSWLKWSLALVVLTFVVFYIPDFFTPSIGASPSEVLAEVQGEPITVGTFQRRYTAQVNAYRNAYGGQLNDQLLKQLGIDRQILQQLIDEEAMVAESTARIDAAVADGTLDADRAEEVKAELVEHITARVNGERPFRGPGADAPPA